MNRFQTFNISATKTTTDKEQETNNKPKSNKKVSNFETVSVVNKETVSQN